MSNPPCVTDAERQQRRHRTQIIERTLPQLLGSTRAQPGPVLRPIGVFGELQDGSQERRAAAVAAETTMPVEVGFHQEQLASIQITVGRIDLSDPGTCDPSDDPCSCVGVRDDRDLCKTLAGRLESTWGASENLGNVRIWLDPLTGHRASLSHQCELTFDLAVAPDRGITLDRTGVIPIGAVGTSPPLATAWNGPGLGAGIGPTSLRGYHKDAAVAGIHARGALSRRGMLAIYARLVQLLGQPETDRARARDTHYMWHRKIPVVLYSDWTPHEDEHSGYQRSYDFVIGIGVAAAYVLNDPNNPP